ncbi:RND family efflux transporter MFP subunit [Candidatus Magnetoovum chiemensis]|nr:RND family efflux transporter MFP subunit [Candidatus Magnetoovum chiemensis]
MKKTVIIIVLLGLTIGGYFIYKRFSVKPQIEVIQSAQVQRSNISETLVATGIVNSKVGAQIKVGARATGVILKMHVKVGQEVRKGQVVAKIDDREIKEEIKRLIILYKDAKDNLEKVRSTTPLSIKEQEENLKSKQAQLKLALIDKKSQEALIAKDYISRNDYDKSNAQYEQLLAETQMLSAGLERIKKQYPLQIKEAQNAEAAALQELELEKIKLTYTEVISPIDGIVTEVTAQEGETIVAGLQVANLITVFIPDELEMWIYLDETDIGNIKEGLKVNYSVDSYRDRQFSGVISRIAPKSQIKDNIVYYIAVVDVSKDDAQFLRPDMTTHVSITTKVKENVLVVPNGAVKFADGKKTVYKVVGKNKVEALEVETGISSQQNTEIISGINEKDEVATMLILPTDTGQKKTERPQYGR